MRSTRQEKHSREPPQRGGCPLSTSALLPRCCREPLLHHYQPLLPKYHVNHTFHFILPSLSEQRCLDRNQDITARETEAGEVQREPSQSFLLSRGGPGATSHTGEDNGGVPCVIRDRAAATQGDTSKDFGKDEFSSVSVERKMAQPRLRDYPKGASKAP